ncbi:hypothetical protein MKEN_01148700 [Mycena kentingensis (nom. inval.)]|nr:hypothetical protein MKEN_01148700 [Mycena kentingensis (nom. inval.)]
MHAAFFLTLVVEQLVLELLLELYIRKPAAELSDSKALTALRALSERFLGALALGALIRAGDQAPEANHFSSHHHLPQPLASQPSSARCDGNASHRLQPPSSPPAGFKVFSSWTLCFGGFPIARTGGGAEGSGEELWAGYAVAGSDDDWFLCSSAESNHFPARYNYRMILMKCRQSVQSAPSAKATDGALGFLMYLVPVSLKQRYMLHAVAFVPPAVVFWCFYLFELSQKLVDFSNANSSGRLYAWIAPGLAYLGTGLGVVVIFAGMAVLGGAGSTEMFGKPKFMRELSFTPHDCIPVLCNVQLKPRHIRLSATGLLASALTALEFWFLHIYADVDFTAWKTRNTTIILMSLCLTFFFVPLASQSNQKSLNDGSEPTESLLFPIFYFALSAGFPCGAIYPELNMQWVYREPADSAPSSIQTLVKSMPRESAVCRDIGQFCFGTLRAFEGGDAALELSQIVARVDPKYRCARTRPARDVEVFVDNRKVPLVGGETRRHEANMSAPSLLGEFVYSAEVDLPQLAA